jgi:hypothetical protein
MIELGLVARKSVADVLRRESLRFRQLPRKRAGDAEHLRETIAWLVRASEHGEGGVSSHYSLLHGRWLPPFPETTGYIIPTLFDYSTRGGNASHAELAGRLTDWLGEVQLESGACMQGSYDRRKGKNKPIIFNTGQNIFGFLRAYEETGRDSYLGCARRAGDFLAGATDERGIWVRALHHNIPHTYNSRTCWPLLMLHRLTGEASYARIAHANLQWVVAQQRDNGWFEHANFKPGELPNTHGIAYTLRGLLESAVLSGVEAYLASARRTADRFLRLFEERRYLFVFWDSQWRNHGKYVKWMRGRHICVTGVIQMALVWMRLFQVIGERQYLDAAFRMIDFVKTLQDIETPHDGIRGGIAGAFPIYGSYSSLKLPNWAAKFWAEALMLRLELANA